MEEIKKKHYNPRENINEKVYTKADEELSQAIGFLLLSGAMANAGSHEIIKVNIPLEEFKSIAFLVLSLFPYTSGLGSINNSLMYEYQNPLSRYKV
jgi:hypothetical protein